MCYGSNDGSNDNNDYENDVNEKGYANKVNM